MKIYLQYPKLLLLVCTFLLSYLLYQMGIFDALPSIFHGHGYISMFIGGTLFSFGFTTPFAVAIFIAMADQVQPLPGALVAGLGALLSDLSIFAFVRFSFMDELHTLKATAIFRWMSDKLHRETVPERIRQYILLSIAGILIASPLPDELGVTMLSGLTEIRKKPFAAMCYALNATGILIILLSAQGIGV